MWDGIAFSGRADGPEDQPPSSGMGPVLRLLPIASGYRRPQSRRVDGVRFAGKSGTMLKYGITSKSASSNRRMDSHPLLTFVLECDENEHLARRDAWATENRVIKTPGESNAAVDTFGYDVLPGRLGDSVRERGPNFIDLVVARESFVSLTVGQTVEIDVTISGLPNPNNRPTLSSNLNSKIPILLDSFQPQSPTPPPPRGLRPWWPRDRLLTIMSRVLCRSPLSRAYPQRTGT